MEVLWWSATMYVESDVDSEIVWIQYKGESCVDHEPSFPSHLPELDTTKGGIWVEILPMV